VRKTSVFFFMGICRNHKVIVFVRPVVDGAQTSV
jgi:hypothetical protein